MFYILSKSFVVVKIFKLKICNKNNVPHVDTNHLELSVHSCSKMMMREVYHIFPHLKKSHESVLAILTIQKSRLDVVRMGREIEEEKDRCLETFMEFAELFIVRLCEEDYWADFIDPCSGLPMKTPDSNRPYSEVAGFEHFRRFQTQNAGCCKVLLHPRWGSACYPATIFTTAPYEAVRDVIDTEYFLTSLEKSI